MFQMGKHPTSRIELFLVVTGALALGASLVAIAAVNEPFGWDEAVYASKSRDWLNGTANSPFALHRAFALPAMGYIVLQFSNAEGAFRIVSAFWAVAAFGGMWLVGRTVFRSWAGLFAGSVFIASATFLRRATQFLTDIPAMALLLVITALLWRELDREDGPSPWILVVGPLAALTTYVRFGSLAALVSVFSVASAIWWRVLIRSWRLIVGVVIGFLVTLIPHFVYSVNVTGTPWGVWLHSGRAAEGSFFGHGAISFLGMLPRGLAGPFAGYLLISALLVGGGVLIRRLSGRRFQVTDRGFGYLVGIGVVSLVLIGLVSPPTPRYVFFSIGVLLIAGAEFLRLLVARFVPNNAQLVVATLIALALGTSFAVSISTEHRFVAETRREGWLPEAAGRLIRNHASVECNVATSQIPQLHWYSGCVASGLRNDSRDYPDQHFIVLVESNNPSWDETSIADTFPENVTLIGSGPNPYGRGRYSGFRLYQVRE